MEVSMLSMVYSSTKRPGRTLPFIATFEEIADLIEANGDATKN